MIAPVIDWWFVASNAIWIFGASVVLAAFSYHHWLAQETGRKLREIFRERSWQIFYPMGATIFCTGWLLAQADRWWERGLWGILAASFCWQMIGGFRMKRPGLPGGPADNEPAG